MRRWNLGGDCDPAQAGVRFAASAAPIRGRWFAYAAALWSLIFAISHFVWASGRYPLLDARQAAHAFATPWKLLYDVIVAWICVFAIVVAVAPLARGLPTLARRAFFACACLGAGFLSLRSLASVIQLSWFSATGRMTWDVALVWEPWLYLGVLLFVWNAAIQYRTLRGCADGS